MSDQTDPERILFPNDTPMDMPEWANRAAAEARLMRRVEPEQESAKPSAQVSVNPNQLFPSERVGADYQGIVESQFSSQMDDARLAGDESRISELNVASRVLTENFKAAGTSEADIREAFDIVRQSQGLVPMTEEQHARSYQRGMEAITEAGITEADLGVARAFISDMIKVSPQVKDALERFGAGNDPKLIAAAVREGRRRGYR